MNKRLAVSLIMVALFSPFVSVAHPGHGNLGDSVLHYFSSPVHLVQIVMVAVLAAFLLLKKDWQKRKS